MSRGISVHLGLNRINPAHYGTDGALRGCVSDAKSMQQIAQKTGFATTLLLNEEATSKRLFAFLKDAQRQLESGDMLLITYAGHGSQVPDLNHDEAPDGKDETWCTFDRMVVDDELGEAWSRFATGVRIVLVSDSCHSATIARQLELIAHATELQEKRSLVEMNIGLLIGEEYCGTELLAYRALPKEFADEVNKTHRDLYTRIQMTTRGNENVDIAASVITLAACADDQTAGDGRDHGLFTQNLLSVWNDGAFRGGYREFLNAIKGCTAGQEPSYLFIGTPNAPFENEKPFTISSSPRAEKAGDNMSQKSDVIDLDQELLAVKANGNGSRQVFDTSNGHGPDWARMEVYVPRQFVIDASDDEIYTFFKTDGADALMKAMIGVKKISIPRGVNGEVGCSIDHEGHVDCHVSVKI